MAQNMESAGKTVTHYLRTALTAAGVKITYDMESELLSVEEAFAEARRDSASLNKVVTDLCNIHP
jgi:hypothetical protein